MKRFFLVATVLCVAGSSGVADAQERWTVELRGGATQATETFLATDLKVGVGFEGTIGLEMAPGLSVYGGWDWQHHRAESVLFNATADVEDTGYAFGLRYVAPLPLPVKPWLRGGGLYNHVEIEKADGSLVADSAHTLGWEVGGGVALPLGGVSLTPGLRYRRFEPDVRFGGTETPATLAYLTYDVGISWKF